MTITAPELLHWHPRIQRAPDPRQGELFQDASDGSPVPATSMPEWIARAEVAALNESRTWSLYRRAALGPGAEAVMAALRHPRIRRDPDPRQGELFAGFDLGDAPPLSKPPARQVFAAAVEPGPTSAPAGTSAQILQFPRRDFRGT